MNTDTPQTAAWSASKAEEIIAVAWLVAGLNAWSAGIRWLAWVLFAKSALDTACTLLMAIAEKNAESRFARQLECELASAQAEKEKWEQIACDKLIEVCMQIEEKKIVTEQRDRLAEALDKVVDAWDHAEWLDENDFESFRAALQSLTNQNEL